MSPEVVVIGAGPAGIGAALALGRNAILLERAHAVAGLCGTLELDGALFDLGGHSFHTPYPAVRDLVFGAVAMEEQRRDAWCWVNGEWVAYPFQKHVAGLADPRARAACLAGIAAAAAGGAAGQAAGATDFDAFLDRRFGRPLADLFMRPYNRKLWGADLTRLAVDWTGERVAAPAGPCNEAFAPAGGRRTPLQADTTVAYPARGGFAGIFEALAARLPDLRLGTAVACIDPARHRLTTDTGETIAWRRIVATMPLPALLATVVGVPQHLIALATQLEAVTLDLVMVVLNGRGPLDRQRIYCPGPELPGHKVVLNHTSSRWLRDRPRHGIQVEVAGRQGGPAVLSRDVVAGLARLGLIGGAADVRRVEVRRLDLGYPVPTHARDRIVGELRAWLAARGILLAGRFAEWAYINSDEALRRGLALGRAIVEDEQAAHAERC